MRREDARSKGMRYLREGRLTVVQVHSDTIVATCRGDGIVHDLGHDHRRRWWCTCEARTDQCSHLAALRLVTIRRRTP